MQLRLYPVDQKDEGFRDFILLNFLQQILPQYHKVSDKEKNIFGKLLVIERVFQVDADLRDKVGFKNSFRVEMLFVLNNFMKQGKSGDADFLASAIVCLIVESS